MPDLEPITREEKLLDGEDLTPITRKEMFIKRIYDKTQEVPEPVTREEMFLKKAGEGSGGDIDLQTLNVTENGTVNAPSGVAYDKVVTNVPSVLPENAYLLEEYEDVPTDIASFTASDAPLKSLTASIVPVQAGSGDPSPTNVRPISGWTEEVVSVRGINQWDEEWEVGGINHTTGQNTETTGIIRSKNYIMVKGNTNYNFLKKTNGIDFHVHWYDADKNFISYEEVYTNNSINYKVATSPQNAVYMRFNLIAGYGTTYNNDISINYPSTDTEYHAYSGTTTTIPFTDGQGQSVEVFGGSVDVVNGGGSAYKKYDSYNGETLVGPWISDRDVYVPNTSPTIGAQVVNMGDTTTFYTQPTSIKSLDGENNVSASTGQIEDLEFFTKEA